MNVCSQDDEMRWEGGENEKEEEKKSKMREAWVGLVRVHN